MCFGFVFVFPHRSALKEKWSLEDCPGVPHVNGSEHFPGSCRQVQARRRLDSHETSGERFWIFFWNFGIPFSLEIGILSNALKST